MKPTIYDLQLLAIKAKNIRLKQELAEKLAANRKEQNSLYMKRKRCLDSFGLPPVEVQLTADQSAKFRQLEAFIAQNTKPRGKPFDAMSEAEKLLPAGWQYAPSTVTQAGNSAAQAVGSQQDFNTVEADQMEAEEVEHLAQEYLEQQIWFRDNGHSYDQSVFEPVTSSERVDNAQQEDDSIESILAKTAGCEG